MRIPFPNSWGYTTSNVGSTRIANAWGTSITPGNNTFPAYTSILSGSNITQDCYLIKIICNSLASSAVSKDGLLTIGVDPAGGTSYVDLIPNLLVSSATAMNVAYGGVTYYFPIFIKAGSQLAAKISVNASSVGTGRVAVVLYGAPTRPEAIWYGTSVEAIGVTTASSRGTFITPGTTSDGSWTSLGTTSAACSYFQMGVGCEDSGMSDLMYTADLGVDNPQRIIIPEALIKSDVGEGLSMDQPPGWFSVPSGSTIYGRIQCSGNADSNISMAAYGVRS